MRAKKVKECYKGLKSVIKKKKKNQCFFKRMLYCFGSGHELLSASAVFAVCQDSKVFLVLLLAVSIIFAPVKSIV